MSSQRFAVVTSRACALSFRLLLLAALASLLGACASTEREQYYGARGRVISADAGDSSTIVSPAKPHPSVARAGRVQP